MSASSGGSSSRPEEEDLLVFGYECKLFRNDEKALWIDSKQHLVPWNGDTSLMIDRFDVRGLLLDQQSFDADLVAPENRGGGASSACKQDANIEALCDEERYLALNKNLHEVKMKEEEEWKRYQEALQEGFHAIGFQYETKLYDPTEPTEEEFADSISVEEPAELPKAEPAPTAAAEAAEEEATQPYIIPKGLIVPHDMKIPESAKLGTVIEKTANFVATQGAQMEIIIKTKQANNKSFRFLSFDHALFPFYRFMVKMIKEKRYAPVIVPDDPKGNSSAKSKSSQSPGAIAKAQVIDHGSSSDSNSDTEDGGYLHPLLTANRNSAPPKPEKTPTPEPAPPVKKDSKELERQKDAILDQTCKQHAFSRVYMEGYGTVVPPPPDIQSIADATAASIVTNASPNEEEERIRYKHYDDPTYSFLWYGYPHHAYYRFRRYLLEERLRVFGVIDPEENRRKLEAEEAAKEAKAVAARLKKLSRSKGPVKFSLADAASKTSKPVTENESALPYESSSEGEEEAAEHLLQDEEQTTQQSHPTPVKTKPGQQLPLNARKPDVITTAAPPNNQDGDQVPAAPVPAAQTDNSAVDAMTQFMTRLKEKDDSPSKEGAKENEESDSMSQYEKHLQQLRKQKADQFLAKLRNHEDVLATSSDPSKSVPEAKTEQAKGDEQPPTHETAEPGESDANTDNGMLNGTHDEATESKAELHEMDDDIKQVEINEKSESGKSENSTESSNVVEKDVVEKESKTKPAKDGSESSSDSREEESKTSSSSRRRRRKHRSRSGSGERSKKRKDDSRRRKKKRRRHHSESEEDSDDGDRHESSKSSRRSHKKRRSIKSKKSRSKKSRHRSDSESDDSS